MGNIDLTILDAVTSGGVYRRGEPSLLKAKDEGGFAEVLAAQEEGFEVASESNKTPEAKERSTLTDKVDVVESAWISADDSEDVDGEIEGENLIQEVPCQRVLSEEVSPGKEISSIEEMFPVEEIFFGEIAFQAVGSKGEEGEIPDSQPEFSDLQFKNGDLSRQNDLLVGGGQEKAEEVQVSFTGGSAAGEIPGVKGAAVTDNFILENSEPVKGDEILTLINSGVNKNDVGSCPGEEGAFIQKSRGSTTPRDEAGFIPLAEDGGLGLQSVESVKSAATYEVEENFVQADREPVVRKDNQDQEPAIATVVSAALGLEDGAPRQIKNGHEPFFEIPSSKGDVAHNGRVEAEIPEEVQIHINNEFAAVKAKSENSVVRSGQEVRTATLTGDEIGVVHLQGRARESQSPLQSSDQLNLKDFSEYKADAGEGEKFSFSGISKKIFEDQATLSSSLQSVAKEKHFSDHTILKSDEMVAVQLETGKDSLVKNSSNIISAKSLPISDENLLEQIQSGLARQVKGRQTVTIRLWPESMGKVDVKLVLRDQQMSATFMVEQSDVKDAMLRKIDSLRDGLTLRGIDVKEIDIKVSPVKSGDGSSTVTVGDQRQDSADTWQQYNQGGFSEFGRGQTNTRGENVRGDSILQSENIVNGVNLSSDEGLISGSLHIMA